MPYLRKLADLLDLKDWRLTISDQEPDDGDYVAEIGIQSQHRTARVALGAKFLVETPEEQRESLVHELLHCHFAPMDHFLRDEIDGACYRAYRRSFEYGIDAAAEVIARSMPLHLAVDPDWSADPDPGPDSSTQSETTTVAKPKMPKAMPKATPAAGAAGKTSKGATRASTPTPASTPKESKMRTGKSKGSMGKC